MPKGYKLVYSDDDIQEIKRLYEEEELRIIDIANIYGVSYTGMWGAMERAGIERRHPNRKYNVDEHAFDVIDNELVVYWLGFIYADGCVNKNFLQVILSHKDKQQLVRLKRFLKAGNPIIKRNPPTGNTSVGLTVNGIHLAARLRELGILPHRPDHTLCVNQIPPELQHHWLRGFFDGDGCADKNGHIIFCGSKELMTWIRNLLALQAGRNPNLKITSHKSGLSYLSYGRAPSSRKIAEYMYQGATIWMERKRNVIDSWPKPISASKRSRKGWITRKKRLEE